MAPLLVKIQYGEQIHRIRYHKRTSVSLASLQQAAAQLFSLPDPVIIKYRYPHQQLAILDDDETLQEVLQSLSQQVDAVTTRQQVLHLYVGAAIKTDASSATSDAIETESPACTTCTAGDQSLLLGQLQLLQSKIDSLSEQMHSEKMHSGMSYTSEARGVPVSTMPATQATFCRDAPAAQLAVLEQQALQLAADVGTKSQRLVDGAAEIASAIAAASSAAALAEQPKRSATYHRSDHTENHSIMPSNVRVMCDGCGETIDDLRFKCDTCDDFDFCWRCHCSIEVRRHHPHDHQFTHSSLLSGRRLAPPFHHAWCDLCGVLIAGQRHKCLECSDYDLCNQCIGMADTLHPQHRFTTIQLPSANVLESKSQQPEQGDVDFDPPCHTNILCDNCDQTIIGVRYKCGNCANFDLCGACERQGTHGHSDEHIFLKIHRPLPRPSPILTPLLPDLYAANCASFFAWASRSIAGLQVPDDKCYPPDTLACDTRSEDYVGSSSSAHLPNNSTEDRCKSNADEQLVATTDSETAAADELSSELLDATFVSTAGVADGTRLVPGQIFTKVWVVTNSGTQTWPTHTHLICIGGDAMGGESVSVPLTAPGQRCVIQASLTAPSAAGQKAAYWRLTTQEGERFGARLWCEIDVEAPHPPSETLPDIADSCTLVVPRLLISCADVSDACDLQSNFDSQDSDSDAESTLLRYTYDDDTPPGQVLPSSPIDSATACPTDKSMMLEATVSVSDTITGIADYRRDSDTDSIAHGSLPPYSASDISDLSTGESTYSYTPSIAISVEQTDDDDDDGSAVLDSDILGDKANIGISLTGAVDLPCYQQCEEAAVCDANEVPAGESTGQAGLAVSPSEVGSILAITDVDEEPPHLAATDEFVVIDSDEWDIAGI